MRPFSEFSEKEGSLINKKERKHKKKRDLRGKQDLVFFISAKKRKSPCKRKGKKSG